jgi:putative inorganic carbon (HCO3(-)) transporter
MENTVTENIIYDAYELPENRFFKFLKRLFFIEKLYSTTGIIILILLGVIIAVGVACFGIVFGILFIGAVVAFPLIYSLFVYPRFGIIVLMIMSYMLFVLGQFGIDGPVGTLMDGLQVFLTFATLAKIKAEKNWKIFKNPISVVILIWLVYNLLELFNPSAGSRVAWLYTIRPVAIVTLSYFIFMCNIKTVEHIKLVFKVWLILTIIGAAYAFKQEYIGFNAHELEYLNTPGIANLLFIDGHWRKFSIFSDPVAFSYNMVMPCIFLICLFLLPLKPWKKVVSAVLILFFFDAMLFSGTRGANVLLPAALILFAILKYNKKVLIFCCFAAAVLVILIYIPTSNVNLYRFQSAFKPNNDPSYIVRKINQKKIQPYILTNPMGGGLGSTGVWGTRFTPGSFLASFPPDSGYIRVAVEEGWLGLLVFCIYMFYIMKTGITNYFLIEDQELKTYCLAMTMIIFTYNLANFPQEALVQYPSNILFYLWAAIINITLRIDQQQKDERSKILQLSV